MYIEKETSLKYLGDIRRENKGESNIKIKSNITGKKIVISSPTNILAAVLKPILVLSIT